MGALMATDEVARGLQGFGPLSTEADYHGPLVGAVYLVRTDGALLMQLRDSKPDLRHAGLWVPPGGHLSPAENMWQGALREFEEETRLRCVNLRWVSALEVTLPPWPTFLLASFWDLYDGSQLYECLEGQDLRFVSREDSNDFPMPPFVGDTWDRVLAHLHH